MKIFFTLSLLLLILVVAIAVGAQNEGQVTVNYLIARSEMNISTLMAVCFLSGVFITLSFTFWQSLRLNWKIKSLTKQINQPDDQ